MNIYDFILYIIITFTIIIPLISTLIYIMIKSDKLESEYKKKVIKYLDKINNENK